MPAVQGQAELGPVHGHYMLRPEVDTGLHQFLRHHMNMFPAVVVLAALEYGQVERTMLFTDRRKVCIVAGIAADK